MSVTYIEKVIDIQVGGKNVALKASPINYGDGVFGLIRFHEFEDLFGTTLDSRANQAAASDSISASRFSPLFSRRSYVGSLRPSVFAPSSRRPLSRSSCLIQLTIDPLAIPSSDAIAFRLRPDRASSVILRRNSGG
jgi:hypothetical protein